MLARAVAASRLACEVHSTAEVEPAAATVPANATLPLSPSGGVLVLRSPLLRWTSNISATRLDGVDAVHRQDAGARGVPTGRSSNSVALATRETE
jgi:hypothetical protein